MTQAIDGKKFLSIAAENVKELIPIVGHRLDFLEKRRDLFKTQNLKDPDELFCDLDDTVGIASASDTNLTLLSASTDALTVETTPKSKCGEKLRLLLSGSPKGEVLLNCTRLTSFERRILCDIIVNHLMITKDKIKVADWQFWTTEISAVFVHEQAEIYYTPYRPAPYRRLAGGKLWDKYCNIRRYIRGKLTPAVNDQLTLDDEIRDVLIRLRAISPQDPDLERLWRLTSPYRKKDSSITDYYHTYPILFSPIGASLLKIDFEEAHLADGNILISSWMSVATKIISYARHSKICQDLLTEDQTTAETLGFLVLPYLFRTYRVATKRGTNWRPSQPEVAKAFIVHITSAGDYERYITERRNYLEKYGITLQPFVLTIGSKTSYDAVYVVVNTTKYECSSLMGAVDLCFKVIWALRAEYQRECEAVWNFIQRFVYNIQDNSISNKNFQVIQTVWTDIQAYAQSNT